MGAVRDVFDQLAEQFKLCQIFSHEETGNAWTFQRDRAVREWCRERGIPWTETWQNGVVRGLKDRNGWSNNWNGRMTTPIAGQVKLKPLTEIEPGPIPPAKDLGLCEDGCTGRQRGGRIAGLKMLEVFLRIEASIIKARCLALSLPLIRVPVSHRTWHSAPYQLVRWLKQQLNNDQ